MIHDFALFNLTGFPLAIVLIVLLVIFIFEITMLISAVRNQHITTSIKVLWIVGMFIIHPLVAIAYYFTDYKKMQ